MALLISVGGLVFVNGLRHASESRHRLANYFEIWSSKFKTPKDYAGEDKEFEWIMQYDTWQDMLRDGEKVLDNIMSDLESIWRWEFGLSVVGIATGLILIFQNDVTGSLLLNKDLLWFILAAISNISLVLQFVFFYYLASKSFRAIRY